MQKKHGLIWLCYFIYLLLIVVSCDQEQSPSHNNQNSTEIKNQNARGTQNSSSPAKKLYIVATTGMVNDAVRNVVGDYAVVDGLMGPGVDPHLYKITAADTNKLARADVIFYNGLHLEGKMTDILKKMQSSKQVHAVTADIPVSQLRAVNPEATIYDPHIWMDVSLWQLAVQKITTVMIQVDPVHTETYRQNSAQYLAKLEELHKWVKQEITSIPTSQRVLITAHDAFGYFGQAYQIEVIALQGISTAAEYGVKDVERITDILVSRKIPAIFVETSVSPKAIEAVIQGAKAQRCLVKLGGSLFSDALGDASGTASTYIGMIQTNVNTITTALKE